MEVIVVIAILLLSASTWGLLRLCAALSRRPS